MSSHEHLTDEMGDLLEDIDATTAEKLDALIGEAKARASVSALARYEGTMADLATDVLNKECEINYSAERFASSLKLLRAIVATFPPPDRARPKVVYDAETFLAGYPETP